MIQKHRVTALIILLSLVATSLSAQTLTPQQGIKELQGRYKSVSSLQADFQEVFEWTATRETVIRSGSLIVMDDDRFVIDTPEQQMVCDGSAVYRLNRVRNQLIIEPANQGNEAMLPKRLLMRFGDDFNPTAIAAETVAGKKGFRLELTPKDASKSLMSSSKIWATEGDWTIYRIAITDLNGNITSYLLSNIQLNQSVKATAFQFTPPSGVETFDMR